MSCHFDSGGISIESGSTRQLDYWNLSFENKEGSTRITMRIPKKGVFEDPHSPEKLSRSACMALAAKIADVLRRELHECDDRGKKKPKKK